MLPAFVAALTLIAGCASAAPTIATQPARATPPSAPVQSASSPAAYACSTSDIFGQPVGAQVRQQVTLGETTAVLTGTSASDGVEPSALRDGVLTITRTGHPAVILPVTAPAGSPIVDLFILDTQVERSSLDAEEAAGSLCLGRFSNGAAPVALLALTTGGAHCCITVRAVSSAGGAAVDHAFGNYPPWFRQTASGPVLVSADNAFAYQFDSFAGSGPPIQLFAWSGAAFTDVTRQHLDLVSDDAHNYLTLFNDPTQPEKLGFLAGYVADECVVGDAASAWAFVDQQRQLGHLVDPDDPPPAAGYEPALRQFVVAHGYCPGDSGQTASQLSSPAE
ncbi:MAG TPA: hypothetical protein VGL75_14390 [Acidothermaceae bacterium]|jgi:hypothetical protein